MVKEVTLIRDTVNAAGTANARCSWWLRGDKCAPDCRLYSQHRYHVQLTSTLNSQPSRRLFFPRIPRPDKMSKRSASPPPAQGTLIKRSRSSEPQNTSQLIISSSGKGREQALIRTVKRTSNLEAPIVSLSGAHGVSVASLGNAVG